MPTAVLSECQLLYKQTPQCVDLLYTEDTDMNVTFYSAHTFFKQTM